MGRGGGLVMAAFLSEADAWGIKHLFQPYRLHVNERRVVVFDSEQSVAANLHLVHQDDLTGANYPLIKEFLLEFGEVIPCNADFQAGMGLVAVTIFPGAEFAVKGGKGRIRSWAEAQASLLKGLVGWINRQEHRSANGARSQKVMVLKKILQLKRRVQAAVDMSHDTWHGIEYSSGAQRVNEAAAPAVPDQRVPVAVSREAVLVTEASASLEPSVTHEVGHLVLETGPSASLEPPVTNEVGPLVLETEPSASLEHSVTPEVGQLVLETEPSASLEHPVTREVGQLVLETGPSASLEHPVTREVGQLVLETEPRSENFVAWSEGGPTGYCIDLAIATLGIPGSLCSLPAKSLVRRGWEFPEDLHCDSEQEMTQTLLRNGVAQMEARSGILVPPPVGGDAAPTKRALGPLFDEAAMTPRKTSNFSRMTPEGPTPDTLLIPHSIDCYGEHAYASSTKLDTCEKDALRDPAPFLQD
ncbi:unnamed protein product [Symbiodinium sp. CCMP2592]|nr:unnamed protein product [Symbiodinium sp. CCMP2592]